jgi:hypothetical protein
MGNKFVAGLGSHTATASGSGFFYTMVSSEAIAKDVCVPAGAFSAGRDASALRQARTPAAASAPRPYSNFEDTL